MELKKTPVKKTVAKKAAKKTAAKKTAKAKDVIEEVEEVLSNIPPKPTLRNEFGLIEGKGYKFDENGFVDWKSAIDKKHFIVNTSWFARHRKEEPVPTKIDGLSDEQLIIRLAGFKDVARIRGFKSVKYNVTHASQESVSVECAIVWNGNYETDGDVEFVGLANASLNNTDGFAQTFLESIAENRAFGRCVRGFLNINIVTDEEISTNFDPKFKADEPSGNPMAKSESGNEESSAVKRMGGGLEIQKILEQNFAEKFGNSDFEEFKNFLRVLWKKEEEKSGTGYKNEDAKGWNSFADIGAKEARKLTQAVQVYVE